MDMTITQVELDTSEANLRSAMIKTIKQGKRCISDETGTCDYVSGLDDDVRCVVGHMVTGAEAQYLSDAVGSLTEHVGLGVAGLITHEMLTLNCDNKESMSDMLQEMQHAHDDWGVHSGHYIEVVLLDAFNEVIVDYPNLFPSGSLTLADIA